MRFSLVSSDPKVQAICREAVTDLFGQHCRLDCWPEPPSAQFSADVYLWDIEAGQPWRDNCPDEHWRHCFFVGKPYLEEFHKHCPYVTNVLLKPVTKSAVTAVLSAVSEKTQAAQTMCCDGLRADRDQILQCLFQTNLKLQEYDQERTNFLARAIHDFRAPLTAITGYCGLLLGGEDLGSLTEEQRQVLERMHRSATKLSRMSNAMFQLSISPRAEQVPEFHPADISDCIEQAVHEILPVAQDKRLTINVNMRPVGRPLCFDRTKVEQVLINLLENACKFTPRGGAVDVAGYPWHWDNTQRTPRAPESLFLQSEPNSYRLDVSDSGPGVPQSHLTRIFEEYTSYAGGNDRSGGGLGLAICRLILRQHHGRIWVETGASGATFSFVLPFERERSGRHETGDRSNNVRTFVAQQQY